MVTLDEAIRCLENCDEKNCQKLFWSLREDYRRRCPYIAYLIKCRQSLMANLAHLDSLLNYVAKDQAICNHNLLSHCVLEFLESKEKAFQIFVKKFQKLHASDEKTKFLEMFLTYLYNGMNNDTVWQTASEEQVEYAKIIGNLPL